MRRGEAPQPAPAQVGLQRLCELFRAQQLQQSRALIPFAIAPAGNAHVDLVRQTKVRTEALAPLPLERFQCRARDVALIERLRRYIASHAAGMNGPADAFAE